MEYTSTDQFGIFWSSLCDTSLLIESCSSNNGYGISQRPCCRNAPGKHLGSISVYSGQRHWWLWPSTVISVAAMGRLSCISSLSSLNRAHMELRSQNRASSSLILTTGRRILIAPPPVAIQNSVDCPQILKFAIFLQRMLQMSSGHAKTS